MDWGDGSRSSTSRGCAAGNPRRSSVIKYPRLMLIDASRAWMALISAEPLQHNETGPPLVRLHW
jgi:hypothetical protein